MKLGNVIFYININSVRAKDSAKEQHTIDTINIGKLKDQSNKILDSTSRIIRLASKYNIVLDSSFNLQKQSQKFFAKRI